MNPHDKVASTEKWGGLCYRPDDRVFLQPQMEQNGCDPEQCTSIYVNYTITSLFFIILSA